MIRRLKLIIVFSIILAMLLISWVPTETVHAASGTSSISVSPSVLNITAGGKGDANYTVKLTSGTTWGTNVAYKSVSGISATFSKGSGDPTFSGKMTVSVASSVTTGTYTISVYATGDDPASNTNVKINVAAPASTNGTSRVVVTSSTLNAKAGESTSTGYSVELSSGTAGNTKLAYQSPTGISATFTKQSGNPTFNGTMTVSVASSVSTGNYVLTLYATGVDPSGDTNLTLGVTGASQVDLLTLHSEKTVQVNAQTTNSYTVSVNTPGSTTSSGGYYYSTSPEAITSYTLTAAISPGTYAMINKTVVSTYNFTLATFNQNSSFSSPSANYTVDFFWVFEVNGQVTTNISFVNSTGAIRHITTEINAPSNWTSYTYLGGALTGSGQDYNYNGGKYVFPNTWTYNSTSKELVNTQFFSPVPWVFVQPAVNKTSHPGNSYGLSGYLIYIIAIIVVIIIIIGALVGIRQSRKRKQ